MFNLKKIESELDNIYNSEYEKVPKLPKHDKYLEIVNEYVASNFGQYRIINQLMYEKQIFGKNIDIRNLFEKVINIQIKHLNILNDIVINLGGENMLTPELADKMHEVHKIDEIRNFWDLAKYNLDILNMKISKYKELIELTNNETLNKIYNKIIDDDLNIKSMFELMSF